MSNATITLTPAPNEKDCFLKAGPFELGSRAQHQSNRQMFGQVVKIFRNFDQTVVIRVRHPNGELWDLSYFSAVTGWPKDYKEQVEEASAAEGQPSVVAEGPIAEGPPKPSIPVCYTEAAEPKRTLVRVQLCYHIIESVNIEVIHPDYIDEQLIKAMAEDFFDSNVDFIRSMAVETVREPRTTSFSLAPKDA
jgi:hypothetical protein